MQGSKDIEGVENKEGGCREVGGEGGEKRDGEKEREGGGRIDVNRQKQIMKK